MSLKKILAFIDWYQPGYKAGGTITAFSNFVSHLSKFYQFDIITRDKDYTDHFPYPGIQQDRWNLRYENEKVYYLSSNRLTIKNIYKLIGNEHYDFVYINGIYSFYFSILPLLLSRLKGISILVNPHGMLSPHAIKIKSAKKQFFITFFKFLGIYDGVTFHVADDLEKSHVLKSFGSKSKVKIAQHLPKIGMTILPSRIKQKNVLHILSVARISPEKNTFFAIQILKEFYAKLSNFQIVLSLYGPVYDENYWEVCKKLIKDLPENIQINYAGSVPPDAIQTILQTAQFLYLPSTGENFGHIILESLQSGCPVIISDRTPWRNLGTAGSKQSAVGSREWAVNNEQSKVNSLTTNSQPPTATGVGWDLPLEKPEEFVKVIEYCALMEQEEYDAMSLRAFEYAKRITEDPEVLEANRRLFE